MELDDLLRRYNQLKGELSAAYQRSPWQSRTIDGLADALATTEREIACRQSASS